MSKSVDVPLGKVKVLFHLFKNDTFNRIAKNLILLGYNTIKGNDSNDKIKIYNITETILS